MKISREKTFKICVSLDDSDIKPQIEGIHYQEITLNPIVMTMLIKKGRTFVHVFKDYTLNGWSNEKNFTRFNIINVENFKQTNCVFIDVDGSDVPMMGLITKLKNTPTISYETFSNGKEGKGNRFRFVYIFEKPIVSNEEYIHLVSSIVGYLKDKVNFQFDASGKNVSQPMFGTGKDAEVYNSYFIYENTEFEEFNDPEFEKELLESRKKKTSVSTTSNNKERKGKRNFTINDVTFVNEFNSLNLFDETEMIGFINKWMLKYPYFDETPLKGLNDRDIPYVLIPDEPEGYQKIIHKWNKNEDGKKSGKVPVGERNKLLYTACQLRKVMIPTVTPEHLLFCLVYDVFYHFNFEDKDLKNIKLFETAFRAHQDNTTLKLKKDARRYIVSEAYCITHNVSKKKVQQMAETELKDKEIMKYYDDSKSIEENLNILNSNGIKVKKSRLYQFKNKFFPKKKNESEDEIIIKSLAYSCVSRAS